MLKVATGKHFYPKATKKLIRYKLGNAIMNLQMKKQNIFLFLLTEPLSFSTYPLLYQPHKPLLSMHTNRRSSRYQRNEEQVWRLIPYSNSSVRWNHELCPRKGKFCVAIIYPPTSLGWYEPQNSNHLTQENNQILSLTRNSSRNKKIPVTRSDDFLWQV